MLKTKCRLIGCILLSAMVMTACQAQEQVVDLDDSLMQVAQIGAETEGESQVEAELSENQLAIQWKPYSTAYVSCEDFARVMHWDYAWDADSFMFQEDEMQLDFVVGSLHVTRQGEIIDVMPQCPILEDQNLYLSVDWLEESFRSAISRFDDRIELVDPDEASLYDLAKFFPDDLKMAMAHPELDSSKRVMAAIELPRSMNIEIPKIDPQKMMNTRPILNYVTEFKLDLQDHGYTDEEIASISYGEYEILHSHWFLSEEMQELALGYYPESAKEDISRWTFGELKDRQMAEVDTARLDRFSEEEWASLQERDIVEADLFYLLKEFHQPATIVAQSDQALREVLEGYYEFGILYWTQMK
ncbi:hypothetical protein SANA_05280 [Gottschalkiaceae bacterium SANA]|nr:hypothetical protein SANA_05280 [Gottschalkiaceae bacterium SANA]